MLPALQVLAQLRVQKPEQDVEHFPEHPLHPVLSPLYGSSISQDVRSDGMVIAATMGNAAEAAFLKNERLSIKFLSMCQVL